MIARAVVHGIRHEVRHHLRQPRPVEPRTSGAASRQADATIRMRGEDFVDHLRHNRIDVDLLRSERRRDAEASAREVHEIVDEA